MPKRLQTGSLPYDDGSGFRYDLDFHEAKDQGDFTDYFWLGNDAVLIEIKDWPQIKADIDKAIAAFQNS